MIRALAGFNWQFSDMRRISGHIDRSIRRNDDG
jgi:hypothetical protein